ncbi:MAG: cation:proton antiporter [Gemmatimonadaceae bacterium]
MFVPELQAAVDLIARDTADDVAKIPQDLTYVVLLFALVVVPKALQRYRIPGAVTSLLLGLAAGLFGLLEVNDTLRLLSTFGIVALFLFAGLEIEGPVLRRNGRALIQYGIIWIGVTALAILLATTVLKFHWRVASLIALALLTPSTGFILSSLDAFGLDAAEREAVKAKAIGAELLALLLLFITVQSTSPLQMLTASVSLVAIVVLIPVALRLFARLVAPYAPRSEFAFLLMVAVVCAFATRKLGVYYLVGAFAVGVAAQRFRQKLPAMSSEKMIDALEAFGSVFIPFYFFRAGMNIPVEALRWAALGWGVGLLIVFVPLRISMTTLHRKYVLGESAERSKRIGISLAPTLVFTLVLADMLRVRYEAPEYIIGGLVFYTVINTALPAFLLRSRPPEFERPLALDVQLVPTAETSASH